MAVLTMYFSALANINTGIITTIWALGPFFNAICDRILFNVKL